MSPATTAPPCPEASNDSNATVAPLAASHVLKIDGYSRTYNKHRGMPQIDSCAFRAGGVAWKISYWPRGSRLGDEYRSFISVFLLLDDADAGAEPVRATATFNLLDQAMKPVPSYSRTFTFTFSASEPGRGYERFIERAELEKSEHLRDDCFALRVDVRVLIEEAEPEPPSDMHRHLGDLFASKEHADVEFRVAGETFVAHRLLLGARSPVFKVQLFGPLIKDKAGSVIEIDDMEAQVFGAMLSFVYTDAWPGMMPQESAMIQGLLVAADRYGLQRLKSMCEHRLCDHIDGCSAEPILALARKHQCLALEEACFDFIGSTTTLLRIREKKEELIRLERLVSSCPPILKYQISDVLDRDWGRDQGVREIVLTLDIQ